MRSSPCFFWTAQLSGLRDTASWCGFPVHAAPWCPLFPHVPHGFSLDFSSMICTCSAVPSGWKTFSPKSDSPANPPIRTEEFGSIAWHTCFYNILSSSFIIIHPSFIIFHQNQNMFLPQPNRVSRVLEMHSLRQVALMAWPLLQWTMDYYWIIVGWILDHYFMIIF